MCNEVQATKIGAFEDILKSFDQQLNVMSENSTVIYDKVNLLKQIPVDPPGGKDDSPSPTEVIPKLNMCINRMRHLNDRIARIKDTLNEIV